MKHSDNSNFLYKINPFKFSLPLQMLLATCFGIFIGLLFGDLCTSLNPFCEAYIMIVKITTVPYLICALIHGLGQLESSQAVQILKKGSFFICLAWTINLILIFLIEMLLPESSGGSQGAYTSLEQSHLNFAGLLIPENIFSALSNNTLPAVVIFSILIGLALMQLKEKSALMSGLETLLSGLTRITSWISRITPLGTFIIISYQVGTINLDTIKQMSAYIILYILAALSIVFWIFPRLISMLTSLNAGKWIKEMLPILLLAYTTNLVIVSLPYMIEMIKRSLISFYPNETQPNNQIQGVVSLVFNLPLGSLFTVAFILFAASFYSVPFTSMERVELVFTTFLTSLGAVGLGSWINTLSFLTEALGLPLETIQLYMTTLPFTSGFQSLISATEISAVSLCITFAYRGLVRLNWKSCLRNLLVIIAPLLLAVYILKSWLPLPQIINQTETIYTLSLPESSSIRIYNTPPSAVVPLPGESSFERILRTRILRVGYNCNAIPFCFYNEKQEIVGYDIAFAIELAHDLGCTLELIPMQYDKIAEGLNNYLFDIGMSGVPINEKDLQLMNFSESYLQEPLVFVTLDKQRKHFNSLSLVEKNPSLRIAVLEGSSFESLAKMLLPHQTIIPLKDYESFTNSGADALLWAQSEGIAWSIQYPSYTVVLPTPAMGSGTFGYPMRQDATRLVQFVNQWLALKKTEGFTQKQYDMWLLGKIEKSASKEPRFSILRNVLHWVD